MTAAPDTVNLAFLSSSTHTPLPMLRVMLPPFMVNLPYDAYTPPPWFAVLSVMLALSFMLKVPLPLTYTPPP